MRPKLSYKYHQTAKKTDNSHPYPFILTRSIALAQLATDEKVEEEEEKKNHRPYLLNLNTTLHLQVSPTDLSDIKENHFTLHICALFPTTPMISSFAF